MTGFHPKVEGFDIAPWHNLQAVRDAITHESAAILVEPIQGEGGVRPASTEFMQGLRSICDEYGLLLICDEVQSGMGRTGKLFAYEWSGITPDIVTSAKALGCGFPLGACLASEKAASCMGVGSHGSTYSGNPLAMTVGRAAFNIIAQDSFQEQVRESGKILHSKLTALAQSYPSVILELRGRGLMLGLKVVRDVKLVARELEMRGLLTAPAGDNTLRVYPALIVEQIHIDEAIGILEEYCRENI
jgi:acetylornithine/N-succinyldiaminopimelate aminotransferase